MFGRKQQGHIPLTSIGVGEYKNSFIWRANFARRYVGLSNGMARPMKLRCCVFNKVFLVNHWRDIFIVFVNGYVLVTLIRA